MIVEKEVVQKIMITNTPFDPIAVYLEDQGKGRGKIIITCFGESWTAYWGAMGDQTIIEFVTTCDNAYLAKNLSKIPTEVDDPDKLKQDMIKTVLSKRKSLDLNEKDAREYFDALSDTDSESLIADQDLLFNVYGEEWWYKIPKRPNPDYVYLCKIITIVKEALSTL
jgi:hypothetical protein